MLSIDKRKAIETTPSIWHNRRTGYYIRNKRTDKPEDQMKPFHQPNAALVAAFLAIGTVPAVAQTYSTSHGTRVNQLDANRFEVAPRSSGSSGYGYWCAAARYVTAGLRQAWTTDITIARERARSETANGRTTVIFTINPAALGIATTGVTQINALSVGQTMNAQSAASLCHYGGGGRGGSR